jgi:HEAT repeat protein
MSELESLLVDLTSGDDARAEAAAGHLPVLGDAAFRYLVPLLRAENSDVRWWAVRALAGFERADGVVMGLATALEDESSEVRQCAALGLCHHPHPQALPALIRALSDPDPMTAKLASNALVLVGEQATPGLIEVLKTGTHSAKLEAARALAQLKDQRAIPALMEALQADSVLLQYWAEQGLDKLGLGMIYIKPE